MHRSTFLIMLIFRSAEIRNSEFGECLHVVVYEKISKGLDKQLMVIRLFNPRCMIGGKHWSISASKGVVPNQISKELFFIESFLDTRDWYSKLDTFDAFCSPVL